MDEEKLIILVQGHECLCNLQHPVPGSCYQKHTDPLNCGTSSSDISAYHADFHEGHGTVGEWQGRGMACVN
jgi:hypothetical protein